MIRERGARIVIVLAAVATSACSHPSLPASPAAPASAASRAAPSPRSSSDPAPPPVAPVPETLAFVAGQFGLTMQAESFTWKVLRRNVTRFDWSGRSHDAAGGEREVLYSFFIDKLDDPALAHLPEIASSAAANLTTTGDTCEPIEQPARIVHELGVDRVVTVCFEPSPFYGGNEQHRNAVVHAIVRGRALTIVAVLSNDSAAILPLPNVIGARGAR